MVRFGSAETRGLSRGWLRNSVGVLSILALTACSDSKSEPEESDGGADGAVASPEPEPPASDLCPDDDDKTEPGLCGCGVAESSADVDDDGVLDCTKAPVLDACPDDGDKTEPGLCGCGVAESSADIDDDGVLDCLKAPVLDGCPDDDTKTQPGLCGCGVAESSADIDEDGVLDCIKAPVLDACPDDDDKTRPGLCGCGVPEGTIDADEDGTPECVTRRVFLAAVPNANFGGVAGADTLCNVAPARPLDPPGTFKAMLGSDERTPCVPGADNCDWVFKPGVRYVRASDGANVAVADAAALLPFPLLNSFHVSWAGEIFSGLEPSLTGWAATNHCLNWRTADRAHTASIGIATRLNREAVASYPQFCSFAATILCVEQ